MKKAKVMRMDLMHPFCGGCHIGILLTHQFVHKDKNKKILFSLRLPFKHMVTKINLVTIVMVIKKIQCQTWGD
jgi:hypothetical protein